MLETAVFASAGGERGHATPVGVVAVHVDAALAAAPETLLVAIGASVAEADELGDPEETKPRTVPA